jgi:hypothetical protein
MLSVIYAECHKKPLMLSVTMVHIIMLWVVMLRVMVPLRQMQSLAVLKF